MTTLGVWGPECITCNMKKNVNKIVSAVVNFEQYNIKNIITSNQPGTCGQVRYFAKKNCDKVNLTVYKREWFPNNLALVKRMMEKSDFFIVFMDDPFTQQFTYEDGINFAIEIQTRLFVVKLVKYRFD